MKKINKKIGFIGAGNMCEAIVGALIQSDIVSVKKIEVSDTSNERLELMGNTYKIKTTQNNINVFFENDIVVFAVKPQDIGVVLEKISKHQKYQIFNRKLIISIAAGITIEKVENFLYPLLDSNSQKNLPIIRVMPNIPSLVLAGMSGMSKNNNVISKDIRIVKTILESMGKVIEFEEKFLDGVTAISGSGPAYIFYFIESMIEAGLKFGFSSEESSVLTLETFKGAIKLLEKRGEAPESLRQKVTSLGGTTEAALKMMEKTGVKKNIIDALVAAAVKSVKLRK